jgi:hypothetical protein
MTTKKKNFLDFKLPNGKAVREFETRGELAYFADLFAGIAERMPKQVRGYIATLDKFFEVDPNNISYYVLPNGKRLMDCTQKEVAAFAKKLAKIADTLPETLSKTYNILEVLGG